MLKSKIALFFCLALLGACTPAPHQNISPAKVPNSFSASAASKQLPSNHWWQAFADEDLNQLEEKLFANNLTLVQGHARLRQTEALMQQARSFRYPSLNLEGQTNRSSQPGRTQYSEGGSSQLSLAAGFELDLFNKLSSRAQAATLNYQASQNDIQSLYMSLSAQLADLYFLAIEQRAQLTLSDQTIKSYDDNLRRIEERYRQGLVASVDVYRARQNLAGAKANSLSFEQALHVAENALAVMLGDYPGSQTFLHQAQLPGAPPQLPSGIPADLLRNRPDLRAAFLRVKARDAETAAAIAERFPTFNLAGSFGLSRSDLTGSLISGDFWNLLAKFSQPLLDAGRRKAEVARNRALFSEAVAAYQEAVLRSFQEVEDALSGNRTAVARIERLSEQTAAATSAQQLALNRYLNGLSDYLPVLTAQILEFDSRSRLLAAQRQLLSQRISLARALGGSWMANQLKKDHQRLSMQEQPK